MKTRTDPARTIIESRIVAAGYGRRNDELAKRAGISRGTYYGHKNTPGSFTVSELRRLDSLVRFTDEEIVAIVRGQTVQNA